MITITGDYSIYPSHLLHHQTTGASTLPRSEGVGSRLPPMPSCRLQSRSKSTESVYTILIKLPSSDSSADEPLMTPSILMIEDASLFPANEKGSLFPSNNEKTYTSAGMRSNIFSIQYLQYNSICNIQYFFNSIFSIQYIYRYEIVPAKHLAARSERGFRLLRSLWKYDHQPSFRLLPQSCRS